MYKQYFISYKFITLLVLSILYTPYISQGVYFRESGAIRKFNNTQKYLSPIPTHECDLHVCMQY